MWEHRSSLPHRKNVPELATVPPPQQEASSHVKWDDWATRVVAGHTHVVGGAASKAAGGGGRSSPRQQRSRWITALGVANEQGATLHRPSVLQLAGGACWSCVAPCSTSTCATRSCVRSWRLASLRCAATHVTLFGQAGSSKLCTSKR